MFADALMDVLTGTDKEEHNHSLLSQRYTLVAEPPKSAILCGMNKICTVDMEMVGFAEGFGKLHEEFLNTQTE